MRALISAAVAISIQAAPTAAPGRAGLPNAIIGRVTGPDGKPVAGAVVTLLYRDEQHGRPQVHLASGQLQIVTDADGRYAIEQIRVGEFFVAAIPHNVARAADGRPNPAGSRITFYPSAAAIEQAMPVVVNTREPQTANIRMIAAPLSMVSGTVFDSKHAPVANATLHIAHGDHLFGIDNAQARARPDGTFTFAGIPPGTYHLQFRESAWPPPRGEMPVLSMATVVVDGRDVSGVRVDPLRAVHVEGRVIVDAAHRAQLPADLTVGALPTEGVGAPTRYGTLTPDLSFAFETWPGHTWIRMLPENGPWRVLRVRYRGADITDSGIDFKEGETVTGIEIEFGPR
jgi:hypothetical protein